MAPRADLAHLARDGYGVYEIPGCIIVTGAPYVTPDKFVDFGHICVMYDGDLESARAGRDHTVRFIGERPSTSDGEPLSVPRLIAEQHAVTKDLISEVMLSFIRKEALRPGRTPAYADFYEQAATYAGLLAVEARKLRPDVRPTAIALDLSGPPSVFEYEDNGAPQSGFSDINAKMAGLRIGVIGVGGTGSYVLDLMAKTPVQEIHLWDDDVFEPHSAFRAPGAYSKEEVEAKRSKAEHFAEVYSKLHKGIRPHAYRVNPDNLTEVLDLDFVFVAIDDDSARQRICEGLQAAGIPFVDVGLGVERIDGRLQGRVRVSRVPSPAVSAADAEYASSSQIADLNSLNASLAVISFKQRLGFYAALAEPEHLFYVVRFNALGTS